MLGRGGVVGELAILTEAPRSAGVRARRDAELLALDRSRFAELLTEEASFTMSLTREIGMQLRASRALEAPASSVPATIALVPLVEERRFEEVREGLRAALERCASIAELDRSDDPHAYGPMLDRAEREATRVLLPTGNPGVADEWTAFCLRQSDRTVVVADDAGLPSPPPASLRGADVLLLASGERAAKPVPLVEALSPGSVHVVRPGADFHRDLARAARRLSGSSVGVVLSGGGARGFCHIGVLRELLDAGLEIDRVGGCSMGAYVGGMFAMEMDPAAMRDRCNEEFVLRSVTSDYTVPLVSLLRGQRAIEMIINTFGTARIETQPRDYFCISADLIAGELVEHRSGLFADAVGASMCLPGVYRPRVQPNRLLVDGGVLNNLPVQQMAARGEGPVIAVDVTADFTAPERGPGRFSPCSHARLGDPRPPIRGGRRRGRAELHRDPHALGQRREHRRRRRRPGARGRPHLPGHGRRPDARLRAARRDDRDRPAGGGRCARGGGAATGAVASDSLAGRSVCPKTGTNGSDGGWRRSRGLCDGSVNCRAEWSRESAVELSRNDAWSIEPPMRGRMYLASIRIRALRKLIGPSVTPSAKSRALEV